MATKKLEIQGGVEGLTENLYNWSLLKKQQLSIEEQLKEIEPEAIAEAQEWFGQEGVKSADVEELGLITLSQRSAWDYNDSELDELEKELKEEEARLVDELKKQKELKSKIKARQKHLVEVGDATLNEEKTKFTLGLKPLKS